MAEHAFTDVDKNIRRAAILKSASDLFITKKSLPSVAEIAAATGLAKGTIYLYFRTKEEIFSEILFNGIDDLISCLNNCLQNLRGNQESKINSFLVVYIAYLSARPELMKLDAMSHSVLERNLDVKQMLQQKKLFIEKLSGAGLLVEKYFLLEKGAGISLLMRTFAFTRGIWQNYPDHVVDKRLKSLGAELYKNFSDETLEALTDYWRGALKNYRSGNRPPTNSVG